MGGRNVRETQSQQRKEKAPNPGPRHKRSGLPLLGIKHQTGHENVLAHCSANRSVIYKSAKGLCAREALLIKRLLEQLFFFLTVKRPVTRRLTEPVLLASADRTVWLAT